MTDQSDDALHGALASLETWLEFERFFGTRLFIRSKGSDTEDVLGERFPEPDASLDSRDRQLAEIGAEASACTRCPLHQSRHHVVFGVGSTTARLALVGEAPGYHEDMEGEPFVGRAGALLTKMLSRMGLQRDDVYICNVLKCRPPENRDPTPEEKVSCSPFLRRQLEVIQPEMILALGAHAARTLLGLDPSTPLGRLRGRTHDWDGVPLVATYHPAYLLRNPPMRWRAMDDLSRVCDHLGLEIVEL